MAQPISVTPILTGKEATKFLNRVCREAKKPVGRIPTPKLVEAEELIKNFSKNGQKHIC